MSLSKPYYRITRPGKAFIPDYVNDNRYASDHMQLSRAYRRIEKDLRTIFDYIEPGDANKNVFSFQLYSLFLRACTEVELNCKEIMEANGATPSGKNFTMTDYKKLEKSSKLSKYKVVFPNWRLSASGQGTDESYIKRDFCPFASFGGDKQATPEWYRDYNAVKHNREGCLEKANLENCINAVAGILILLYSQFGSQCVGFYKDMGFCWVELDSYDYDFATDVIFDIIPPGKDDWQEDEQYDFNWEDIKDLDEPFESFGF